MDVWPTIARIFASLAALVLVVLQRRVAVVMARDQWQGTNGKGPIVMARDIVDAQQAQIDHMNQMLGAQ